MQIAQESGESGVCLARRAGALYFLLIPLGVFGILYVPQTVFITGDITATLAQVQAHALLIKSAIVAALLIQLVNLATALQLYWLLGVVNKTMATLMVLFIVIAMPIAMLNELSFLGLLRLAEMPQSASVLEHATILITSHEDGIKIAGIFWGLWLFPMGFLFYRATFLPSVIGVLLIIGGVGYLMDSFSYLLLESYWPLSDYTFFGELAAIGWLLIKAVDAQKYDETREKALKAA